MADINDRTESEEEKRVACELVSRIRAGDTRAEAAFAKRYGPRLSFFLRKRASNPSMAEDACQEALILVIQRLRKDELDEPEKLARFTYRTGQYVLLNMIRGDHDDRRVVLETETSDKGPSPLDSAIDEEGRQILRRLVDELPNRRDRDILYLVCVADTDNPAAAKTLGIDEDNFRKVLYRARKRLNDLIKQSGFGSE